MRFVFFWDFLQRRVVITTDVSGQPIGPSFKDQEAFVFLTIEDGVDTPSRKVGTLLPLGAE
jgi:hypothetical protein